MKKMNGESYQCLAVLQKDGNTFRKKRNQSIAQPSGYTAHIKRSKVWQEEETIWWNGVRTLKK